MIFEATTYFCLSSATDWQLLVRLTQTRVKLEILLSGIMPGNCSLIILLTLIK